jgi:hypothetical protein
MAVPKATLKELLQHAAFAAHLVGHLDDDAHADLIGQLGDHVDAIAHDLTEILGDPRALAEHDDDAPDDRAPHDGIPALASSVEGPGDASSTCVGEPDVRRRGRGELPPPAHREGRSVRHHRR